MFGYKCTFVIFLLCVLNAIAYNEPYTFPEPEIQVFTPKGFRIRLEDSPGITQVHFHLNISRELDDGFKSFSKVVRRPNPNGKWVFAKPGVQLDVGDTINYNIFVIKNGFGYKHEGVSCTVQELQRRQPNRRYKLNNQQDGVIQSCKTIRESLPTSDTESSEDDTGYTLSLCEQAILNTTFALTSLQDNVKQLTERNSRLLNYLERYPDAKQLTLSGRIPPDGDASTTVKFILREKLDLNPAIHSAKRHSHYNITFEVETVTDKIRILEESIEKLKYSKIIIS